jgi:hypothetical protein
VNTISPELQRLAGIIGRALIGDKNAKVAVMAALVTKQEPQEPR